jgi:hypothetical protein
LEVPCLKALGNNWTLTDVCFRDYKYNEVMNNRENAKAWFNQQKNAYPYWDKKLLTLWKKRHQDDYIDFCTTVGELLNKCFKQKEKDQRKSMV